MQLGGDRRADPGSTAPRHESLPERLRLAIRRPAVAVLVLLAIYVGLSLIADPRGFLSPDSASKVATLRAMDERGDLVPDLGYWAEAADPEGTMHPIVGARRQDVGWVSLTTLPMTYLAVPLFRLGGERTILVLPMLGSILAALAARALARRLGGDGWLAFWVVGLASPMVVYALDFWEHSLGVALMAWAVVLLFDVWDAGGGVLQSLGAGALFGAATTLRQEGLVYGATAVAVVVVALAVRGRMARAVAAGAAAAGSLLGIVAVNELVERWVLGSGVRLTRAGDIAGSAGESTADRLRDGLTMTFGASGSGRGVLVGMLAATLFLLAARYLARPEADARRLGILALLGATVAVPLTVLPHFTYISGLVAAAPLVALGAVSAWSDDRRRLVATIAILPIPVVWAVGPSPGLQWGGRFLLTSGLLLTVLACVALDRFRLPDRALLLVPMIAVALCGLAMVVSRTNEASEAFASLTRRPEEIVVSTQGQLLREAGGYYEPENRWLTVTGRADLERLEAVLDESGASDLALVDLANGDDTDEPPEIASFQPTRTDQRPLFLGVELQITHYDRVS